MRLKTFPFVLIVLIAVGAFAFISEERTLVSPVAVIVRGTLGEPLEGVRVSQSAEAYSYDTHNGGDTRTDERGYAYFPGWTERHSLLYGNARPIATWFNYGVHASFGLDVHIHITDVNWRSADWFSCRNESCKKIPKVLEFGAIPNVLQ